MTKPIAWILFHPDRDYWESRVNIYPVKQEGGDWIQFPVYLPNPPPEPQKTIDKQVKANTEFKDEWVGLTEEEMLKAEEGCSYMDAFELTLYAEKIEAILKEKNRG